MGYRVIRQILHEPKYLIPWELWYGSILRSCKFFSINSVSDSIMLGSVFYTPPYLRI